MLVGLELTLYVGQDRYSPLIQRSGIRVAIHTSKSLPLMNEGGMDISAGTDTSISLQTVSSPKCFLEIEVRMKFTIWRLSFINHRFQYFIRNPAIWTLIVIPWVIIEQGFTIFNAAPTGCTYRLLVWIEYKNISMLEIHQLFSLVYEQALIFLLEIYHLNGALNETKCGFKKKNSLTSDRFEVWGLVEFKPH